MSEFELREIAIHEAGHAVATSLLRVKLKTTTIVPRGDALGSSSSANVMRGINHDFDRWSTKRLAAEKAIMILLAGPAAHRRHNSDAPRDFRESSDYSEALKVAELIDPPRVLENGQWENEAATASLRYLEIVTDQMIEQNWPQVEAVATALIDKGTLSGPELEQTIYASRIAGFQPVTL